MKELIFFGWSLTCTQTRTHKPKARCFVFFPCQLSHPVFFLEKAELIGLKFRVLCGDGLSALLRARHVLLPSIFTTAPIRVGGAAVRGKNCQNTSGAARVDGETQRSNITMGNPMAIIDFPRHE